MQIVQIVQIVWIVRTLRSVLMGILWCLIVSMDLLALSPMRVFVPVVPQLGLVQKKEKNDSNEQHQEQIRRTRWRLKGLGQEV